MWREGYRRFLKVIKSCDSKDLVIVLFFLKKYEDECLKQASTTVAFGLISLPSKHHLDGKITLLYMASLQSAQDSYFTINITFFIFLLILT